MTNGEQFPGSSEPIQPEVVRQSGDDLGNFEERLDEYLEGPDIDNEVPEEVVVDVVENREDIVSTPVKTSRGRKAVALLAGAATMVGGSYFLFTRDGGNSKAYAKPKVSPSAQPSLEELDKACPDSWAVVQTNNEKSRLITEGVPSIEKAKTDLQARAALNEWFNIVKHDPELLAGTANAFANKSYESKNLIDGNCFNSAGEQIAAELETTFALASVKPGEAPATGYNTGVDAAGNVVTDDQPGIQGDRSAVEITKKDGKKAWVMARCGNPAFPGKPNLPEGPTDEDEPTPTPTPTPFPNKTPQGTIPGSVPNQPGSGGSPEEGMDPQNDSDADGYGPGDTRPTVTPSPTPSGSNSTQPTPNQSPTPAPTSTYETNPSPKPTGSATASPNPTAQPSPSSTNTPPPPDN